MTENKVRNNQFPIPEEMVEKLQPIRNKQIISASKVSIENEVDLSSLHGVLGLNISYSSKDDVGCVAAVLVNFQTLQLMKQHHSFYQPEIEYIPTFLGYREAPAYRKIIEYFNDESVELLIFNGNGILHPYRYGLATQVGYEVDIPSIGITKTLLLGEYEPPLKKFGYSKIFVDGEVLGVAYQSMNSPANPIFVSQGYKINLQTMVGVLREFFVRQQHQSKYPTPLHLATGLSQEKMDQEINK